MLPFEAPRRIVLDERLCLAATPSVGGRWTCSVFDVVVNVGGFGQTEEQLVLQALVFATVGASIALGLHTTTLVLVKAAVNSRSSKHQRRAVIVHLNWVCIFLGFHSFGL